MQGTEGGFGAELDASICLGLNGGAKWEKARMGNPIGRPSREVWSIMRHSLRMALLAATLISPLFFVNCAARIRVYDGDHHDYHRWNHREAGFYQRWEMESRRDHRDFDRRSDDEKRDYWNWRHAH